MIRIRPLRVAEVSTIKRLISIVAYDIFGFDGSIEDSLRYFEAAGEYRDIENLESEYFGNRGVFLGAFDGENLIGTGAVRRLDDARCELKRMWLLNEYHGRGIGFMLFKHLQTFALRERYRFMRLQTSPRQVRALHFYERLGFQPIPCYNDEVNEISMEMSISALASDAREQVRDSH